MLCPSSLSWLLLTVAVDFFGRPLAGPAEPSVLPSGSALPGFSEHASTPGASPHEFPAGRSAPQLGSRHSPALSGPATPVNKQTFIQDWTGTNGGLRSFSNLESFDARPLHATNSEAQMRVRMQWTTPVGPVEDVRDFQLAHRGDEWKVVWIRLRRPTFRPRSFR